MEKCASVQRNRTGQQRHSRVVCGHGLGRLAVPLDGLHGRGVEHPLAQRAFAVHRHLARLAPLLLAVVQHMHPQQQAVVHDLKAF